MALDYQIPTPSKYLTKPRETSPLLPDRDPSSSGTMWRNLAAATQRAERMTVVATQMQSRIARLEARLLTVAPLLKHPFKIYQPSPQACIQPENAWRTFAVRSGIVGFRPKWLLYDNGFGGLYDQWKYLNNCYEYPMRVIIGSDGYPYHASEAGVISPGYQDEIDPTPQVQSASGTNLVELSGTDWQTCVDIDNFHSGTQGCQFMFPTLSGWTPGVVGVAFQIKVTDPPLSSSIYGPEAYIQARCFLPNEDFIFDNEDPYVIPVGIVLNNGGDFFPDVPEQTFTTHQYIFHNMLNRYPQCGDASMGTYRGEWFDDDREGLALQTFYPGDLVSVNTATSPTTAGKRLFIWKGYGIHKVWRWDIQPTYTPSDPDYPWKLIAGFHGVL